MQSAQTNFDDVRDKKMQIEGPEKPTCSPSCCAKRKEERSDNEGWAQIWGVSGLRSQKTRHKYDRKDMTRKLDGEQLEGNQFHRGKNARKWIDSCLTDKFHRVKLDSANFDGGYFY